MSDASEETDRPPAVTGRAAESGLDSLDSIDPVDRVDSIDRVDARDDALVEEVDAVMQRAARQAGDRWRCGPGRTDCCIGPFPIDRLDARRLARGMAALERDDPQRAQAVRERAAAAVELLEEDFPGDPRTGILNGDIDELLDSCDWHEDLACPALDPRSGLCELYRWRPLVCRTFGPPLRVHDETWKACPYCFSGRTPRVELDPENRFGELCAGVERATGVAGETFIAFALLGRPKSDPPAPGRRARDVSRGPDARASRARSGTLRLIESKTRPPDDG
jgi:Fe-S-cluster containining protein